jgi:hypothetical protein
MSILQRAPPARLALASDSAREATRAFGIDPIIVYNLRAKLDAAGFYDDFEVDRVAEVELNPKATSSRWLARSRTGFAQS